MDVSIRPATAKDAEKIADIYVASVSTLCTKDYTNEQIEIIACLHDAESYREAIESNNIKIFLAVAKEVVGFASILIDEWKIGDLFVLPNFTRQGIATRLLNAVEKYALQAQIYKLSVTASLTARPFYSACGYKYVRDSLIAEKIETVEMTKPLSQFGNSRNSKRYRNPNVITLRDCFKFTIGLLFGKSV